MTEPRFWRRLLAARVTHTWGNFSWVSLSTVLASANDTLAKLDGGRIIDSRRMRWVAAQRAAGHDPYIAVRMPEARSLLLLGDPGEMDPSQYVLVRDLHEVEADALLLMSDVVYPAGDINAWRDAVYLPYLGEPAEAWQGPGAKFGVTPRKRPIFATPGNHDWYDGLNGFMYHACSAEPLSSVEYSSSGLGFVQRLTRRAWQSPARPDRPMLEPLRAAAARCWNGPPGASGSIPNQPGPYFALDIGTAGTQEADRAVLRLVTVDTGVDGSIDTEQERWIEKMLQGSVPKIVITGKPLITGNEVQDLPVNPPLRHHGKDWRSRGLMDLLRKPTARMVVATVAGDIHNAQRMVLAGEVKAIGGAQPPGRRRCAVRLDADAFSKARGHGVAPVNIVAGGGGAYLSETHTTRLTREEGLEVGDLPEICSEAHHRFPAREVSAQRCARTVGRWAGSVLVLVGLAFPTVLLGMLAYGAASVDRKVEFHEQSLPIWTVTGAAYALIFFTGICAVTVAEYHRRNAVRAAAATVVTLAAFAGTLWLWDVSWKQAPILLIATGVALAIPLLPLALPAVRAFPLLKRYVPTRLLLGTAIGAAGVWVADAAASFEHLIPALLAGLVLAIVGAVFVRWLAAKLAELHDDWAVKGEKKLGRFAILLLSLWPIGLIGVLAVAVRSSNDLHGFDRLIVLMLLLDLSVILAVVTVLLARALLGTMRFAPPAAVVGVFLGALAGGVALARFADTLVEFEDWPKRAASGTVGAAALLLALSGFVLWASTKPARHDHVGDALRRRDHGGGKRRHGFDLFRTMTVAAVPGISEIAEAATPPFHKSFLTIDAERDSTRSTTIVFRIFGVDEERAPDSRADQDPPELDCDDVTRGAFLVDELTVTVDAQGAYAAPGRPA